MSNYEIDSDDLDAALSAVTAELSEILKSEAALAKTAKDDAPSEESSGSGPPTEPDMDAEGASPPMDEGSPPAPEASAAADESAPPAEESSPEQSAAAMAPEGSPEHEAGEIEPAPTVEELQAEYTKLDPEALKMHFLAAKAALMAAMGGPEQAPPPMAPEASAAPPAMGPPGGAPPMPPEASAPPMGKGEMKMKQHASSGNGGEMKALGKSEKDFQIEALEKQLAAQTEAVAGLTQVVSQLYPIRKSVKGVSDLRYVERTATEAPSPVASLSKSEILDKLKSKIRDGKLQKSDKELISAYTVGRIDVSKIEHLLVTAK